MNKDTIILYGSYGYTGSLIAQECKSKMLNVILSGRDGEALRKQSLITGFPFEVVDLQDIKPLKKLLQQGKLLIHCAGPFQYTANAMVQACIETATHYTDITGEYQVFEMLAEYNERGREAGIMIMPGVGFDVVPSDCLAVHLKQRLPEATHLQLAFSMSKGGLSRGTAKTAVETLGTGSTTIRLYSKLVTVPFGQRLLEVDFGSYTTKALNITWGDIATAWRSTGIPNVEVFMGASNKLIRYAQWSKYFNWVLRQHWVKKYLITKINRRKPGPSEEQRTGGRSRLWGKVWDQQGRVCITTLETSNGYTLTAQASVLIAEKILQGNFKPGYQTPAMAFGPDMILELENTTRVDR